MDAFFDCIVVGGGLCGVGCALTLASSGSKVLLVERRPVLGWESTWAGQLELGTADSQVLQEVTAEMERVGGARQGTLDAPILEMVLDRMVEGAGISLLLYTYPLRLVCEGDSASGVMLGSRNGESHVGAGVIIDATEEALLWTQTGLRGTRDKVPGLSSFYMNHVEEGLELPLDLGDGVLVRASIWRREVRVEYSVRDANSLCARTDLPKVINSARRVPQLAGALVSHVSNEVFPLRPKVQFDGEGPRNPRIRNLLGCGIWAVRTENTPGARLALGEKVGHLAATEAGTYARASGTSVTGTVSSGPETRSDVLIVGGGTAGSVAAITAARAGAETTLMDPQLALGGIGTTGAIHSYYYGVSGGIQDEIETRVSELSPLFLGRWKARGFHPEAKKQVLHEMALEAGVNLRLDTVATGVILDEDDSVTPIKGTEGKLQKRGENPRLSGVIAASPTGVELHQAKVTLDCTGDGDVAAMAGAPFIIGRESDNVCHTYSQPAGVLDPTDGSLRSLNFDAGYVDPTDVADATRARRFGVQLYWRERATEESRILYLAPLLGIRQGRQIVGEYQLTLADLIAGRRFDDAISYAKANYDNHAHDYENESEQAALWVWGLGNWETVIGCEVPYRCLLPVNVEGLLLASRALSLTYDAHTCFRMQKDIQRIGEVAALAAVQSLRKGVNLREVDVQELRQELRERGILDDKHRPKSAIREAKVAELRDASPLDPDKAKDLVWLAVREGDTGIAALRAAARSDDPKVAFKASVALASLGSEDGVKKLLTHVQERTEEASGAYHAVPLWQAALPFLGIAGSPRAVPHLIGVLRDGDAPLDALIASVRALGRIGDTGAMDALRELLLRDDLPTKRVFRKPPVVGDFAEDAGWQLDLVTAEAMSRLGAPHSEIAKIAMRHLDDPRAYVRRYAGRVLREAGIGGPG